MWPTIAYLCLITKAPSGAGHYIPWLQNRNACLKPYINLPPLIFPSLLQISRLMLEISTFLSCHWYQTTGAGKKSDRACSRCEMKWLAILISCRLWPWPSLHDGKLWSEDQWGVKQQPPTSLLLINHSSAWKQKNREKARVGRQFLVEDTVCPLYWPLFSSLFIQSIGVTLLAFYINYCWT